MRLLLVLVLLLPGAAALDALPDESHFAAHEARLVVRVADGAPLHVITDTPTFASLDGVVWTSTPAVLQVPTGASWHGLPRAIEVHLRRGDASTETRIDLDDGSQTGTTFAWPPARTTPGVGGLSVLVLLACLAFIKQPGKW